MNPTSSQSSEVKFEIGHVLFIDIVGYSKLLINEQSEQLQKLKEIVRETEQFRLAEAEGKLLRLPTGDGGALVFRNNPEAPVLCALEISEALKKHPDLRVRMGIHSGPVNEVTDLNEQANIAGAGINLAQRVMDCGDAGHILLSRHVAEDLEHYPRWQASLHHLGEVEMKHGHKVSVVNLYNNDFGNPALPQKFRQIGPKVTTSAGRDKFSRITIAAGAIALVAAALFAYQRMARSRAPSHLEGEPPATPSLAGARPSIPEKSIAVLPFENLSDDKSNAYAYALRGRRDDALKILAQLKDESARHYVPAYGFAIIHLGLGDKAEALRWLEKDFSDQDGWNIGFINVDPILDPLRGDPRFEALVQKVFAPKSESKP